MAPSLVHLPNGQTMTVSPIFGGLSFKANDLNIHHSIFPPGWTIILESEDGDEDLDDHNATSQPKKHQTHRYRMPTLNRDNLFISSISNPSSTDFKPATSPTRQTAMMLWATLWWYFHQVLIQNDLANLQLILEASLNRTLISAPVSAPRYQRKPDQRASGESISNEKESSREDIYCRSLSAWVL